MRLIITILIILIIQTKFLYAQQSFENDLLLLEQNIYYSQSKVERNDFCYQKLSLYIKNKNYSAEALAEAKRIDYTLFSDSTKAFCFLWNSAIIAELNNDKNAALYYLSQYTIDSKDTSVPVNLLAVLINNNYNSNEVVRVVSKLTKVDIKFDSLLCLNKANEYKIKNKIAYPIASAIVPGLGSMINGNIMQGTNSLLINSVSAYGIYLLIQNNLYANAFLWGTGLGVKFYAGNIKLTQHLVEKKELLKKNALAEDCKCVLNRFLKEYPLEFK